MLGIAIPEGQNPTKEQLVSFKKRHNLTYPLLADRNGTVSTLFGVQGIPDIRLVDRQGRYAGSADGIAQAVQKVQQLLQEKNPKAK